MNTIRPTMQPPAPAPGRLRRVPPGFAGPILTGALVAAAGIVPWTVLARLNARVRPDLPWAAVATAVYLVLLITWLNGVGWPRRTAAARRRRLRLWPAMPPAADDGSSLSVPAIVLLLALLYVAWVLMSTATASGAPDLSAYTTTSYRISVFVMGAVVSGVVEEAAFRGYMQTGLEQRHGAGTALFATSLVFALFHGVHGLGTLLLFGPGMFAAAWLYGLLALRTGTILPGMLIHFAGDLAHTYFAVLRGDGSLLFVP